MKLFISFEGIDGCGKSTQIKLLSDRLKSNNINNIIIREPGDTLISDEIRNILLDEKNKIGNISETMLFLSARSQLVDEKIIPFYKNSNVILCDRFIDSTTAYQGYGRNLDVKMIDSLNAFVTKSIVPDITFILDINCNVAYNRLESKNLDRMESVGLDFLIKVAEGYKKIALNNEDRCKLVDCNQKDIISVHNEIVDIFNLHYGKDVL